tara:strand:+ start:144423 stop:145727 length:1305 start_codon:yes stop_codon:yes gene_type:complete
MSVDAEVRTPVVNRSYKNRRRIFGFVALAISSLASLACLELACRALGFAPVAPEPAKDLSTLHPQEFIREAQLNEWIHWPSEEATIVTDEHPDGVIQFRRNQSSFREDQETPINKPAQTLRIVVMGDSHTDGAVRNSKSYANLLESKLCDAKTKRVVDVINAGFSVFSPYQELWAYKKVLKHFDPDMLIVGFYAGNDIWDLAATDRVHLELRDDQFVHAPKPQVDEPDYKDISGFRRFKNYFRDRFGLYQALASIDILRSVFGQAPESDEMVDRIDKVAAVGSGAYFQCLGQAHFFAKNPEAWDQCREKMRYVMEQFQLETKDADVELLYLIIPTLRQIHPESDIDRLNQVAEILDLTEDDLNCDERACEMVAEMAKELGISVIDLRPAFRKAIAETQGLQLYWRFDHHINLAGHQAVADEIETYLLGHPIAAE